MDKRLSDLINISREIASQRDYPKLFRNVVATGCETLQAEGGTFYLYDEKDHALKAVVALNSKLKELNFVLDEYDPNNIKSLFAVALHRGDGQQGSISGECWRTKQPEFITSIKSNRKYDLTNILKFDKQYSYRTRAILAVPIINQNGNVIGVLQLVNPSTRAMHDHNIEFIRTMSVLIGIALENNLLLIGVNTLLDSVVAMISAAIDARSKVTGGHSFRVTELTMLIAQRMEQARSGPYRSFGLSDAERHELKTAALIHDVGKIATPDYVLEKSRKLQQVCDRIDYLRLRFAARGLELRIQQLERAMRAKGVKPPRDTATRSEREDFDFIAGLNAGGEFLTDDMRARLEEIAARPCLDGDLIEGEDLENLSIGRGTLNPSEREIMEAHAQKSIDLLSHLPWPRHLGNVPEIAGKHHENEDGSGYPLGLRGDQMSIGAKILSIADRFEGLSAPDRTYRKPKTVAEVMRIMDFMRKDGHIDSQLFDFFTDCGIHIEYSRKYLTPAQLKDLGPQPRPATARKKKAAAKPRKRRVAAKASG